MSAQKVLSAPRVSDHPGLLKNATRLATAMADATHDAAFRAALKTLTSRLTNDPLEQERLGDGLYGIACTWSKDAAEFGVNFGFMAKVAVAMADPETPSVTAD